MAKPRWKRRKDDRPAEIVDAAIEVFARNGYANANLDDVAKKAGVAKGTLYRYFATKEDMFRAVVRSGLSTNLQNLEHAASAFQGSLADFLPLLLERAADRMGDKRLPAIARMVLTESRAFPDLATVWHDEVVARMLALLTGIIRKGQQQGDIRAGDPKLYAFTILGPMAMGVLFHEVFGASRNAPNLKKLAKQHAETVLRGLLVPAHLAKGGRS